MQLSILPARHRIEYSAIAYSAIQQALRPASYLLLAMLVAWSLSPALVAAAEPAHPAAQTPALTRQQLLLQQMQHNWPQQLRTGPASSVDQLTLISWWHQGKAGRALWRYHAEQQHWQLLICAGKALLDPAYLQQLGLTASQAQQLSAAQQRAETVLSEDERLALDSFMATAAQHPPTTHQH